MATDSEQAHGQVRTGRFGVVEAFIYVGLMLGTVGGLLATYQWQPALDWWARALIDGAYVVVGVAVGIVLMRRPSTPMRDRGVATAVAVASVGLGVVCIEVLFGAGVFNSGIPAVDSNSVFTMAAALAALLLIVALAWWRNFLLVFLLVAADFAAVNFGTAAIQNGSVSSPEVVIPAVFAGGGLVLLLTSLLPRLRGSDHAEFLRLFGMVGLVFGMSQGPAGDVHTWLNVGGVCVALAGILLAATLGAGSRGIVAGGVAGVVVATFLLLRGQVTDLGTANLVMLGIGSGVFVIGVVVAVVSGRTVQPIPSMLLSTAVPMPAASPLPVAATPVPVEAAPVVAAAEPPLEPGSQPVTGAETSAPVENAVPDAAPPPVATPPAGATISDDKNYWWDAAAGAWMRMPQPEPVIEPELVAETPAEVVAAPDAALPPVATPPAGATISDDKNYWWDAAAGAWQRVPISPDGYYYFDGATWQPRPR